jgi:AP endonuclease-2
MNPTGIFENGARIQDLAQKDILPLSAKLIPEFDRRRSIKDMFFKKATGGATSAAPRITEDTVLSASGSSQTNDDGIAGEAELATQLVDMKAAIVPLNTKESVEPSNLQPCKRSLDSVDPFPRQLKRSRSGADPLGSKQKITQGQTTLKGFFKPVGSGESSATTAVKEPRGSKMDKGTTTKNTSFAKASSKEPAGKEPVPLTPEPHTRDDDKDAITGSPERVFDPIEAKESWSKLLGKRVVPRCEHDEPCISLITKKPGVNCGTFTLALYQLSATWLALQSSVTIRSD